jgi:hypothetical protein
VAAGLSILSKGPVPLATVALPVGLWMLIYHRRRRVWLDVMMAAVLAAAVALPWLVVIGQTYPDAWGMWSGEFVQFATSKPNMVGGNAAELRDPWYYYFQFFLWMMPFTPLFVGGLLVPLLPVESNPPPDGVERRGRWLMWLIVVLGLVLLSLPSEKKARYALQLIPAAALLVAIVWQEFSRLDPKAPIKAAAGFLLWCNQLLVVVAGLLLILAALISGPLARMWAANLGGMDRLRPLADLPNAVRPAIHTLTWPGAVVVGLALIALSVGLQRAQTSRRFIRAASVYLLAAWILNLAIVIGYYGSVAYHRDPAQQATEFMRALADGRPIYTMDYRPWLPVLWSAGRILPEQSADDLIAKARARPREPLYVLVPVSGWDDQPLRAIAAATGRAWQPRYVFSDGHRFIQMVVYFPR